MPILLLIRHATNDFVKTGRLPGRTPNIHLNDEGRAQAAALAGSLQPHPPDAVYSSPLERAIETAWPIAARYGLPIVVCPALADIDNGDFTGKEIKKLSEDEATKAFWQVVVEKPSQVKFPNGEAMLDMQRRVVDALEAIIVAHPDVEAPPKPGAEAKDRLTGAALAGPSTPTGDGKPARRPQVVAVVAHADVIKAALAYYLDMPFDSFQKLGVSPASVSTVMIGHDERTGRRRVTVMNVNRTAS